MAVSAPFIYFTTRYAERFNLRKMEVLLASSLLCIISLVFPISVQQGQIKIWIVWVAVILILPWGIREIRKRVGKNQETAFYEQNADIYKNEVALCSNSEFIEVEKEVKAEESIQKVEENKVEAEESLVKVEEENKVEAEESLVKVEEENEVEAEESILKVEEENEVEAEESLLKVEEENEVEAEESLLKVEEENEVEAEESLLKVEEENEVEAEESLLEVEEENKVEAEESLPEAEGEFIDALQLSLEESIEKGFQAKEEGKHQLATEWFIYALDKNPPPDIAFYLIIDSYWLCTNNLTSEAAIKRVKPYIVQYFKDAPLEWRIELLEWLEKEKINENFN